MTYSKENNFNSEFQEIAKLCKALSHPARVAILVHLSKCCNCMSGDITKEIPLSRTTVSQHLQELKKVGLIQGEIDGVKVNYCLNYDVVNKYFDLIKVFTNSVSSGENILKCC
ncbi:MAG: hypothetical protein A2046_10730 [Bacteroidetes bacterium GWA2_30_7]|nr:MAG: hypothetical protein A2046_10730 [Bacteroidetes bacterium GWA2_30_7]